MHEKLAALKAAFEDLGLELSTCHIGSDSCVVVRQVGYDTLRKSAHFEMSIDGDKIEMFII
jgi:hypothetical protein